MLCASGFLLTYIGLHDTFTLTPTILDLFLTGSCRYRNAMYTTSATNIDFWNDIRMMSVGVRACIWRSRSCICSQSVRHGAIATDRLANTLRVSYFQRPSVLVSPTIGTT